VAGGGLRATGILAAAALGWAIAALDQTGLPYSTLEGWASQRPNMTRPSPRW